MTTPKFCSKRSKAGALTSARGRPPGCKPKLYNPRHPERTLLYCTIAEHFETWAELVSDLECGIFAHGFGRTRCDDCGHDSLNAHVHFHVCVVDGVFEVAADETQADPATPPNIIFHPASGIDAATVAQVQADLRRRILRAFVGRGLIERIDAKEMLAYQHSGFSVDAGVCIEGTRPRRTGAALTLLRSTTLCHGSTAQRRRRAGVPLRETAQRTYG